MTHEQNRHLYLYPKTQTIYFLTNFLIMEKFVEEEKKKDHDAVISEEALKGFGLLAIMILLQIFILIPLAGCGNVLYLSRYDYCHLTTGDLPRPRH